MDTLSEMLRYWADLRPDHLAVTIEGQELTWAELDRSSDAIAAGLAARGIGERDVIAILTENCLEFIEVTFAALKLGAIVSPLNIRWTASELLYPLQDSGARLMIASEVFAEKVAIVSEKLPHLQTYFVTASGQGSFDELRATSEPTPAWRGEGSDVAFVCYTSGTTGFPKGSLITHEGILAAGVAKALAAGITWRDKLLIVNPLVYTSGILTKFLETAFVVGAATVITRGFHPAEFLRLVEEEGITMTSAVPVILEAVMHNEAFATTDLSTLSIVWAGGAAVSEALLLTWRSRGVPLMQAYGLTELSGASGILLSPEDAEARPTSAGRPVLFHKVRIVESDGTECERGEIGEIAIRGPAVMKGYLNRPEQTAETIRDGWLHTGDMGRMDAEGYIYIIDRRKDLIISGGINTYPAEIERVLSGRLGLDELSVIGIPDERWGQVPVLLVPQVEQVDVPELIALCEAELADYKRPKYLIDVGGPLPRTLSGKVDKNDLRDRFGAPPADAIALRRTSR